MCFRHILCLWLVNPFLYHLFPFPSPLSLLLFKTFFPFLNFNRMFPSPVPTLSSTHSFLATLLHKFALSLVPCTHIAAVLFPSTFLFSFCFSSDWIGARRDGYFFLLLHSPFFFILSFLYFHLEGKHKKSTLFILKSVLETKEGNARCCRFC